MEANQHTTTDEPTTELKNFHQFFDSEDDVREYADEFETVTVTLTYDSSYSDDNVTFTGELDTYGDWGFIVRQYDDCRIVQGNQVKTDTGDYTRCIGKHWQVSTESVEEDDSGNEESNRGISEFTGSSSDDELHGTTDYPGVSGEVLTAECRAYVVQSDGVHDREEWAEPDENGILRDDSDLVDGGNMYGAQGWYVAELDISELDANGGQELVTDGGRDTEQATYHQFVDDTEDCEKGIGEWANRGGMPCPHRMSAAMELVLRWDIEYDEATEFLEASAYYETGADADDAGQELVTDGGESCPVEPQERDEDGQPVCDSCRLRIVNVEDSGFGDACLCQDCQQDRLEEFKQQFTLSGGDQVEAKSTPGVVMPMDITTKSTDRRGRFTLGQRYGNKNVTIAVVDVEGGIDDE